jgi:hypothetical protein
LRDLLFVVHLLGSQTSNVATIGLWSLKAYRSVGLNAKHRRSLSVRAARSTPPNAEKCSLRGKPRGT